MKGLIQYDDIKGLPFADVLKHVVASDKLNYGVMTVSDLVVAEKLPAMKIFEKWQPLVFGYGVYIFFDGLTPVYAGEAKDFLHRFHSHRGYDGRPEWGFNQMARNIAEQKLHDRNLAYNKITFYEKVMPEVEKLDVVRINMLNNSAPRNKCSRIEKLFRKGYYDAPYASLFNGISNVSKYDNTKTLEHLIK